MMIILLTRPDIYFTGSVQSLFSVNVWVASLVAAVTVLLNLSTEFRSSTEITENISDRFSR